MTRAVFAAALLAAAGVAAAQHSPAATPPAEKAAQGADKAKKFELMVGDKAPALTVEKWVKGRPVTGFEKGKVYLVDFWATWCGPCIASMPHLSQLQKEYADDGLTVIGLSSKDSRGNTLDAVETMVADKGDTMGYTVAWDSERETNNAYMKASGRGGIPSAFLVDREGRIAYIGTGFPMEGLDEAIEQVVAGTFDIEKATADYARQIANEEKLRPLNGKLQNALRQQDWDGAMKVTDEMEELDPSLAPNLAFTRFRILLEKGDYDRAYGFARDAVNGAASTNAQMLNAIAWTIVDPDGTVETKDLDLAQKAAEKAVELTKSEDAAVLDTLAMVHHLKGNHDKAIELQAKAVDLAQDESMKSELQQRLDEFKKAKGKN